MGKNYHILSKGDNNVMHKNKAFGIFSTPTYIKIPKRQHQNKFTYTEKLSNNIRV